MASPASLASGAPDRSKPPLPEPLLHPVVDSHCHLDMTDSSWLATDRALAEAASASALSVASQELSVMSRWQWLSTTGCSNGSGRGGLLRSGAPDARDAGDAIAAGYFLCTAS